MGEGRCEEAATDAHAEAEGVDERLANAWNVSHSTDC